MRRLPFAILLILLAPPATASAAAQPVAWAPTRHQW
jgi:hypothetical protein